MVITATNDDYCEWRLDRYSINVWQGSCGIYWSLNDGSPKENKMNFCPKCGRELKELKSNE